MVIVTLPATLNLTYLANPGLLVEPRFDLGNNISQLRQSQKIQGTAIEKSRTAYSQEHGHGLLKKRTGKPGRQEPTGYHEQQGHAKGRYADLSEATQQIGNRKATQFFI